MMVPPSVTPMPSPAQDASPRFPASILKWVGAVTAVISLILGGNQVVKLATERSQRSRASSELVALAKQQASRGEFAAAWTSLDQAEQQVKTEATADARLDVAFRWLEEARPGPGQPFSRITDPVVPALDRALLDAQNPRRADVLAHLGWATFLKWRETGTGDPAAQYKAALEIDKANVFANAMLGHWLMWKGGTPESARPYFEAALAAGKEHDFVRQLQVAALRNRNNEDGDLELVLVANSMRQHDEPVDERTARGVHLFFVRKYGPNPSPSYQKPIAMSPGDQLATFVWLTKMPAVTYRREISDYVVARLKENAGDVPGAIASWREILPKVADDPGLRQDITRQIARLEHGPRIASPARP